MGSELLTIEYILEQATQRLTAAGCDTPQLDAEVLLAHLLNKERSWLYLQIKSRLDNRQRDSFLELIDRREKREPVAYIIGYKEFFALDFLVTPHVLIPRPETELLVETAVQLATNKLQNDATKSKIVLADVGTGSGCLAIALAKQDIDATIFAIDISQPALMVAQRNAEKHQVSDRITFLTGNLLAPVDTPLDMIVSNPPYVSRSELASPLMMPEVGRYEPRLALAGGQDGLEIIQKLLAQAKDKLKPDGTLLVEIGFEQGLVVRRLAERFFPEATIEIKQDLAGLDRMLTLKKI